MKRGINFIMKKSIRSLALLGVCALSLTACGEVKFADFQTAAETALKKEVEYTTAKASGSITTKSSDSESKKTIDFSFTVSGRTLTGSGIEGLAYGLWLTAMTPATFTASENTEYKYYNLGVSYNAKDDDGNTISTEYKWNDCGLITKYTGYSTIGTTKGKVSISVSYSK